jgi:predicted nucleic acid-binding protein
MILDTTFLSDLHAEQQERRAGPATHFLGVHRAESFLATVISVGELVPIFASESEAREYFDRYRILRLHLQIAFVAGALDREQIASGQRLGENDTWIAAFCRYYGQAIVSRDRGFDRVRGLRRVAY